jgi:outer membrane protein TolC
MRRLLALCAVLAAPPAVFGQQVEVTLDDAVQQALRVQPLIVTGRGEQRNAAASVRANIASLLPIIDARASSARAGGARYVTDANAILDVTPQTTYSNSLNATLDLFTGFRRLADRRVATASLDAADAGLIDRRFQVILATKQAFYSAIANEALVLVAEAQLRRADQQLQISVEKLRAGSATRSDSLRSVVERGNAQLALLQARANLATAQATLGRQIGLDNPVRAVLPDTLLPEFPDTTAMRAQLASTAPTVLRAEAQARAARAQVSARRAAYWPTFSASVSGGYSGLEPALSTSQEVGSNWEWRFGLRWTVFDGLSRERQVTQDAVQRDIRQAEALDKRREVYASLTQQLAALANSFAAIDIARSNVAAATEDLRVQSERYRVGASTILDLLLSQAQLTEAERGLIQSMFDYVIARAQLEALLGRTL